MPNKISGFTLLETLIAMLILAIGLLGMAGLMLNSMKSNQSSYQRTQASLLAYDMAERLRLNTDLATAGDSYVITSTASAGTDVNCAPCTPANMAAKDRFEWITALNREGLAATVARNNRSYTINVTWNISLDANNSGCGSETCSFQLRVNL